MKKLLFLLMAALLLTACGSSDEKGTAKEGSNESKLELGETKFGFTNVTIEIEKAYTKNNLLVLETRFTNDSYDGELSFNTGGYIEVEQNEKQIEEVSGVKDGNKGNYYYKNKVGINTPVKFEYELLNKEDDVTITIGSTNFDDEAKEVTISL